MNKEMRVMTEKPLNAETPAAYLQSWLTGSDVFFKRNQGQIMSSPVDLESWRLSIEGLVEEGVELSFSDILAMPKVEMAVTLECSGNGRSLLQEKASGNPWTIGGPAGRRAEKGRRGRRGRPRQLRGAGPAPGFRRRAFYPQHSPGQGHGLHHSGL